MAQAVITNTGFRSRSLRAPRVELMKHVRAAAKRSRQRDEIAMGMALVATGRETGVRV